MTKWRAHVVHTVWLNTSTWWGPLGTPLNPALTVTKHFEAMDSLRFLNIIYYDAVDAMNTYDSDLSYILRHINWECW